MFFLGSDGEQVDDRRSEPSFPGLYGAYAPSRFRVSLRLVLMPTPRPPRGSDGALAKPEDSSLVRSSIHTPRIAATAVPAACPSRAHGNSKVAPP